MRFGKQARAHFKPELECVMAKSGDDDIFDVRPGGPRRGGRRESPARFPKALGRATGNNGNKRARAAWFTRKTGAGKVKLAHERPA
ncbi:MAG TPA: hypothetical protein DHW63_09405, partial [Hyphomonadaceae bacterium]|nr:hypothetical protein [Hyphomonadaceae bacterium]